MRSAERRMVKITYTQFVIDNISDVPLLNTQYFQNSAETVKRTS